MLMRLTLGLSAVANAVVAVSLLLKGEPFEGFGFIVFAVLCSAACVDEMYR